jgi:hypothetical protein
MRYLLLGLFLVSAVLTWGQAEIQFMPRLKGKEITYYALAKDFEEMVGFQFSLNWNPDSMSYKSLEFRKDMKYGAINPNFANRGQILMSWFADGPAYSRNDCDTLFTMKFISLRGISDIRISSTPLKKEIVNSRGVTQLRSRVVPDCGLTSSEDRSPADYSFELVPSLCGKGETLRIETEFTKPIMLEIFGVGGKLLVQRDIGPGLTFEAPETAGVYIYRLVYNEKAIHSDRFVVQ